MRCTQHTLAALLFIGGVVLVPVLVWMALLPATVGAADADAAVAEAEADGRAANAFDHSAWNDLLAAHVDADGWVDYAGFAKDAAKLDAYLVTLAQADDAALARDEKLAFLINAYNAFTIRLILDYRDEGGLGSIFDIPEAKRWEHSRWELAGKRVSLNELEHQIIRPVFKEPRIHFALVCAAVGCPPLRAEAYTGAGLEAQLAAQSAYVHTHATWLQLDAEAGTLKLTELYNWYAEDFVQHAGSVVDYVATQSPAVAAAHKAGKSLDVSFLDYSWKLNDVRHRPKP